MTVVASLVGAAKRYGQGELAVQALQPTDLRIEGGKVTMLLGPSGSGKTTILSLLGCVTYPSSGNVSVLECDTGSLDERGLAALRLRAIGFVFQNFNLLQPLSALDNVAFPLLLQGVSRTERHRIAGDALRALGLGDKLQRKPRELSGGQQQRVAIARALVAQPRLILCDEPTAALDATSAALVIERLVALKDSGAAIVIVTHDERLVRHADRVIRIADGAVTQDDRAS